MHSAITQTAKHPSTQTPTWSQGDYFRALSHRVTRAEFDEVIHAYTHTADPDDALEHAHEMLQLVKRYPDALSLDDTAQAMFDIYCLLEQKLIATDTYEYTSVAYPLTNQLACDFAEYMRTTQRVTHGGTQ
jgi:hypothetical protein